MKPEHTTAPRKLSNANIVYILAGLAVLVVFIAIIIVSVMKRNPMNAALTPDAPYEDINSGISVAYNDGVTVDRIDVMILESFPVQVNALVRGYLSDGCLSITDTAVRRDGDTFYADFLTTRTGEMCTQALVPFEKTVSLPVAGVKAGNYTVSAVGTTATFKMVIDNTPAFESDK